MAQAKRFLDLPPELRNHIYNDVIHNITYTGLCEYRRIRYWACTKKPAALIDRSDNVTQPRFYSGELFRSGSAIIAVNHQIHDELHAALENSIIHKAQRMSVHISDFDFQPFMEWLANLPLRQLSRFQKGGQCKIHFNLDFELFTPLQQTGLRTWLIFAGWALVKVKELVVADSLHPQLEVCTGHGFGNAEWAAKYLEYVESVKSVKYGRYEYYEEISRWLWTETQPFQDIDEVRWDQIDDAMKMGQKIAQSEEAPKHSGCTDLKFDCFVQLPYGTRYVSMLQYQQFGWG